MTLEEIRAVMLSGAMYNDVDPVLVAERRRAVAMTNEYNSLFGIDDERRGEILRALLKSVGENVSFERDFRCEFGFNISIGDNFFANFDCVMLDCAEIIIGDDVLFGPRVGIYTANHAVDRQERRLGGCYARPVRIGSGVWLGGGVHVNQGVSIGEGSIIGAGAVVTRDIPANVIAAGVPCRVLREITEADRTGWRP